MSTKKEDRVKEAEKSVLAELTRAKNKLKSGLDHFKEVIGEDYNKIVFKDSLPKNEEELQNWYNNEGYCCLMNQCCDLIPKATVQYLPPVYAVNDQQHSIETNFIMIQDLRRCFLCKLNFNLAYSSWLGDILSDLDNAVTESFKRLGIDFELLVKELSAKKELTSGSDIDKDSSKGDNA